MDQIIKDRIEQINHGDVPDGYKKSDIGVIPCDWESDELGNLGHFYKGKGLPGAEMKESGVPCIGYGDIYTKYNFKFDKALSFVDKEIADKSQPIEKGTLLFTGSGETAEEIGKCICYCGNETIYAGGDIVLFDSKKINPLFIAYQQYIEPCIKQKAQFGQGHSVVHIYSRSLKELTAVYPKDDREQEKIVNILMKWDEVLSLQGELIEKLEIQRKVIMKKILIPKQNWKEVKLADLGITYGGLSGKSKSDFGKGKPYIPYMNVFSNCIIDVDFVDYIDINDNEKQNKVEYGDILFTISSETPDEVGMSSVLLSHIEDLYLNSFCFGLRLFDFTRLLPNFAAYYFRSDYFRNFLNTLAQGATRFNISKNTLMKCNIFLPPLQEQIDIAKILTALDSNIGLQKQKLLKLKELQKSLMQLLLTGITRINNG